MYHFTSACRNPKKKGKHVYFLLRTQSACEDSDETRTQAHISYFIPACHLKRKRWSVLPNNNNKKTEQNDAIESSIASHHFITVCNKRRHHFCEQSSD